MTTLASKPRFDRADLILDKGLAKLKALPPLTKEEVKERDIQDAKIKDMSSRIEPTYPALIREGFSKYHLSIIEGTHLTKKFNPQHEVIKTIKPYFENMNKNWLFLLSASGAGKTMALNYLAYRSRESRKVMNIGYCVMSELIDAIYQRKVYPQSLLRYDAFVIDDFFKSEGITVRMQDLIKNIIDMFLRYNKILWIGADIDMATIASKLSDEYKEQIIYRIKEKCESHIYGFDDMPNLRRSDD